MSDLDQKTLILYHLSKITSKVIFEILLFRPISREMGCPLFRVTTVWKIFKWIFLLDFLKNFNKILEHGRRCRIYSTLTCTIFDLTSLSLSSMTHKTDHVYKYILSLKPVFTSFFKKEKTLKAGFCSKSNIYLKGLLKLRVSTE